MPREDHVYDALVHKIAETFVDYCDVPSDILTNEDRLDFVSGAMEFIDLFDYLKMPPEAFVNAWRSVEPVS